MHGAVISDFGAGYEPVGDFRYTVALMTQADGFNPNALETLRRLGGDALVDRMLALFLKEAPRKLEEARCSLKERDFERVAGIVHPLKSSADYVGATAVRELARQIETSIRRGETGPVTVLMAELDGALQSAVAELTSIVDDRRKK